MRRRLLALRYLLIGARNSVAYLVMFILHCTVLAFLPFLAVVSAVSPRADGLTVFVTLPRVRAWADAERRRAGALLGEPIEPPYRSADDPVARQLGTLITDPSTWRDFAWLGLGGYVSLVAALLGLVLLASAPLAVAMPLLRVVSPDLAQGVMINGIPADTAWGAWLTVPAGIVNGLLGWLLLPYLARTDARLAQWLLAPTRQTVLDPAGRAVGQQ